MKIKVTPKEKKLIDGLHAVDNEGTFYFSRRYENDYMSYFYDMLYFMYGTHTIEVCYDDSDLHFKNVIKEHIYKYEDFILE